MESNTWLSNQYAIVAELAHKEGKGIRNVLDECVNNREIKKITNIKERYQLLLKEISKLSTLSLSQLIDSLFPEGQNTTQVLREASLLFLKSNPIASENDLWNCIETLLTQPEMPEEGDFVRIMSLHKSKGLTSKVTIITSCIQGLVPNINDELR